MFLCDKVTLVFANAPVVYNQLTYYEVTMKYFTIIFFFVISNFAFASNFTLKSSSIKTSETIKNDFVFNSFGCQGLNQSPQLEWKNSPKETKSFAITVYDPDAPTGSGWWHWTLFNIPAHTNSLPLNASGDKSLLPNGSIQGRTDFGKPGYGGPCPPAGSKPHRYIFTVYALKVEKIELNEEASGAMVGFYLGQNALSKASIVAKYNRP